MTNHALETVNIHGLSIGAPQVMGAIRMVPLLRPNAPRHRRHQHPPVPVVHGLRLPQWPRDLRRLVLLPDLRQPDRLTGQHGQQALAV